jgi:hypothetical protein
MSSPPAGNDSRPRDIPLDIPLDIPADTRPAERERRIPAIDQDGEGKVARR